MSRFWFLDSGFGFLFFVFFAQKTNKTKKQKQFGKTKTRKLASRVVASRVELVDGPMLDALEQAIADDLWLDLAATVCVLD